MMRRFLPLAVFCLIVPVLPMRAAEAEKNVPTVVLRLQSIDGLIENVKYLVAMADREEEAKQIEGFLKSMAGPKGIEGIDSSKPLGLYAKVNPGGVDSSVVVLVPIADDKAFLDLLARLNVKVEEGKDGIFTASAERSPLPVFFRFANHYAYATIADKGNIATEKLLSPSKVLAGNDGGILSLLVRLDEIPGNLKEIALGQLELQLANEKDKKEKDETKAQHELKIQMLDEFFGHLTSVIRDGGTSKLQLDLDR